MMLLEVGAENDVSHVSIGDSICSETKNKNDEAGNTTKSAHSLRTSTGES
jgi:hypothetical protein